MIVRIDVQNHGFHALALLQHFGRMFDAARRNIGNMNQPVDSFFDFDERAEVRQISHTAGNDGTDDIAFRQCRPRIRFRLLETQRNAAVLHVDFENDALRLPVPI